jgi:uncharacterized protein YxeA
VIKILLLVLIIFGAWNYYTNNMNADISTSYSSKPNSYESKKKITLAKSQPQYQCDGRQHCSQMSSYEEAKYFNDNCPDTKMDGDYDGIPCERQFGR